MRDVEGHSSKAMKSLDKEVEASMKMDGGVGLEHNGRQRGKGRS